MAKLNTVNLHLTTCTSTGKPHHFVTLVSFTSLWPQEINFQLFTSDTAVNQSHIPQASHFHRLFYSCGLLSLGISYAMLMRPNKDGTAVHGC